jgi:pyruvate kinase
MAANVTTSTTATVSGTDPNFIVAYKSTNKKVVLMVKYTKNTETGLTLTFDVLNPSLHATDKYRMVLIDTVSYSAQYSVTFTASGNYRVTLTKLQSETVIYANAVFGSANQGGAAVINFMES